MKKAPKIKRLAEGGSLTPNIPFKKGQRKYKDDIGSVAEDALLASIDNPLSTIGLGNVIKSSDYQSQLGAKTMNQVNNGVQEIGPGVAAAVLNYYVPGIGSLVTAGTDAAKSATGPDKGLNASDSAAQASIGLAIRSLGSMGGSSSDKSGIIGGIDKMINNPAKGTDGTKVIVDKKKTNNPNTVTSSPTAIQNETESGTILGEDRHFSNGGQVHGKGTTKSDSIDATVEEGGFIVPAENAQIAMLLRAKYLSGSPTKKANV